MMGTNEYGEALFLLCEEQGSTEAVLPELKMCKEILAENPDYVKMLESPALSKEKRLQLIKEAFSSVKEELFNLMCILCEKGLMHIFDGCAKEFFSLYNSTRGIIEVEAVSAVPMSEEQKRNMIHVLESKTGKSIILKNTVDESLIGGVVLRYMGRQLDGSLKAGINKLGEMLRSAAIRSVDQGEN